MKLAFVRCLAAVAVAAVVVPVLFAVAADPAHAPLGLPTLKVPEDNPITPDKVELGKMLYFDPRVSADDTVSCASCHDPKKGWAERTPTSTGIKKQVGGRNAPSVINAAYAAAQFWDGRAATLEDQAGGPVANPIEMGQPDLATAIAKLNKIPGYVSRFQKVFGTPVTEKGFVQAIAAFERTVLSGDSAYDRYKAGDSKALSSVQKRGLDKFMANCASCHAPPMFTNYRYVNAGVGMDKPNPDEGRKKVTGKTGDLGRFRTPSLRDACITGPYFHDGSCEKLADAVAFMTNGGKDNPNLSAQLQSLRGKLSAADQKDIIEFLKALTGKAPVIEPPTLP